MTPGQYVTTPAGEQAVVIQNVPPRTIVRRPGHVKPESHITDTLVPVLNEDKTPKMRPTL